MLTLFHLGFSVPFWNQLLLLTYFFIRRKTDDAFDYIFEQFLTSSIENNITETALNNFLQTSSKYLPYVIKDSKRYSIDTKHLITMIGILPITKNNLNIIYLSSSSFFTHFMNKIFEHWSDIMCFMYESSLTWFGEGIAKLLCFKLWTPANFIPNLRDTTDEAIRFLKLIPVEEKRQQIVDFMLKQLVAINRPLPGSAWTDLFDLANPNQLNFKHFELITSIDSYVKCLIKFAIINKSNSIDIKQELQQLLQDFINRSCFISKYRRI